MNKPFLTLLLSFMCSLCHAQVFYPLDSFYQKGATWTEVYGYEDDGWEFIEDYLNGYQYFVGDDSLVAGQNYHLLYKQSIGTIYKWGEYYNNPGTFGGGYGSDSNDFKPKLFGGLRSSNSKIYLRFFDSVFVYVSWVDSMLFTPDTEVVLYDFNPHQVGDTITWKTDSNIIQLVDTLALPNGQYTKRYWFTIGSGMGFNDADKWVVGLGSNKGLLGTYGTAVLGNSNLHGYYTQCYSNADFSIQTGNPISELFFGLGWDCTGKIESVPTIASQALGIYPNPAINEVNIDGQGLLRICDITGREVLHAQLNGNTHHTVDISMFRSGMYIYSLSYDNMMNTGKLSVTR